MCAIDFRTVLFHTLFVFAASTVGCAASPAPVAKPLSADDHAVLPRATPHPIARLPQEPQ